ncbi:hypothetical protein BSKO_12583 [Bryopsis sp. KO-2023]|nr:hypothetical protein BSKO_12583 [Bryopsis sp. KO-2023]
MVSPHRSAILSACFAGLFGALAGCTGKFAGTVEHYVELESHALLLARFATYGAMILLNGFMLSNYLRSLQSLPSLQATVLSNASNISLTGLMGYFAYSEDLSWSWCCGIVLLFCGTILVTAAGQDDSKPQKTHRE